MEHIEGAPATDYSEPAVEKQQTIEFGPKSTVPIDFVLLNEIEQIRKTYPQDRIEDLARSIDLSQDGTLSFDLYNSPLCAHLTPEETTEYLRKHSIFYGTETKDLSDLKSDDEGNYTIFIAGHRRRRAISFLVDKYDLPPEQVQVFVNLREHISFEDALIAQIRENTHDQVPPDEVAKNIQQHYHYLQRISPDKKPTYAQMSNLTGYSEYTISSALKFMQLPEDIRELPKQYGGIISYTTVVELEPLMRAFGAYHDTKHLSEDKETYIYNSLQIVVKGILESKLTNRDKIADIIHAKINSLRTAIDFDQDAFFEMETESTILQNKRANNKLATTAIRALAFAVQDGAKLKETDAEILLQIADQIRDEQSQSATLSEFNGHQDDLFSQAG